MEILELKLAKKIRNILPYLTEKQRRLYLYSEANAIGRGGVSLISRLSNVSRPTIMQGKEDFLCNNQEESRNRKTGGGRKSIKEKHPEIIKELDKLIGPSTLGDPMSPLRWSCKSTRNIADELQKKDYKISHVVVSKLLKEMGYSLQANKKTQEGGNHPDRNEQFEYINDLGIKYIQSGNPVVSIDTKKKEQIGNYKNGGKSLIA